MRRNSCLLGQEDDRREVLQLSEAQLADVVRFCNRYPDIQMAHQVLNADNVRAGDQARCVLDSAVLYPEASCQSSPCP